MLYLCNIYAIYIGYVYTVYTCFVNVYKYVYICYVRGAFDNFPDFFYGH